MLLQVVFQPVTHVEPSIVSIQKHEMQAEQPSRWQSDAWPILALIRTVSRLTSGIKSMAAKIRYKSCDDIHPESNVSYNV